MKRKHIAIKMTPLSAYPGVFNGADNILDNGADNFLDGSEPLIAELEIKGRWPEKYLKSLTVIADSTGITVSGVDGWLVHPDINSFISANPWFWNQKNASAFVPLVIPNPCSYQELIDRNWEPANFD